MTTLNPTQLHEYQKECILHGLYNPETMLWLQMGLGKTIIALTTIVDRMRAGQVQKTVIFGPLRVIESVWKEEASKWNHTKHLRFSVIRGGSQKRIRAMFREADIYLINYELINWFSQTLLHYYADRPLPFQMVIYDEISKLKNSTSLRVAGGNRIRTDTSGIEHKIRVDGWRELISRFKFKMGLTGTPASNGYIDLHGQYLVVDNGKRLYPRITSYRKAFFNTNWNGWGYSVTELGKTEIEKRIADITIKMDAADYLDMPKVKTMNLMVKLPDKIRTFYNDLEKEMFVKLDEDVDVEVGNKACLTNKCLQFCNGTPYIDIETREYKILHDVKLKALEDIIEEAGGSPIICSYTFKSDAERIMKHFRKLKPVNLTDAKSGSTSRIINQFKAGKIRLLIGHPQSMGHGIDGLQESGSIMVWFGLNWSLEMYEQMNGRLVRQGQTKPVSIIHILCENTVDMAVLDAIENKNSTQKGLKASLDKYRGKIVDDEVSFL